MSSQISATVPSTRSSGALGRIWMGTRPFRPALVVDVVLFTALCISQPGFRTGLNIQNLLSSISILWVMSMAMTFVLVSGGFDLSVGAIAACSGVAMAKLLQAGVPGPVALVLAIAIGASLGGALNGVLVGVFRLSVFVVTLATMTALLGVVLVWTQTQSIYVSSATIQAISIDRVLGVQSPIWIMAAVLAVAAYVQTRTYFGRDIFATGGSFTAARLSGIRTSRTLIGVYAFSGACAALAGAIAVGRVGAATPNVDTAIALQAIAAVLLGGTALVGGSGSVVGTAFGVLFIGILQNGLDMMGVQSAWQYVVTGVVLIVAILGDRLGDRGRSLFSRRRMAHAAAPEWCSSPAEVK